MSIIITKFHYSETEAHETEAQIWYYSFLKPIWKNTIRLDTLRFKESNGIKFVKIWTSNNPGFL